MSLQAVQLNKIQLITKTQNNLACNGLYLLLRIKGLLIKGKINKHVKANATKIIPPTLLGIDLSIP